MNGTPLKLATSLLCLIVALSIKAQNGTPRYTQAAAGGQGNVYAYVNAYTSAGTCTNSFEYQPPDFNWLDGKKYPLIIFFPGVNQTIQANDSRNVDLGASFNGLEAPTLLSDGYTNPSIVKMAKIAFPRYILSERPPYNIQGPGGTLYSYIFVGVQCADVENIDNYEKFIRGYVFQKYKDKIDPSRVYITGLSLGGGKTMEFFASASRTSLIAAAAPVATGTECPYTPEYISSYTSPTVPPQWTACANTSQYTQILNNIAASPNLGVWFNHNVDDRSKAPYKISKEFFYDPLMSIRPANTGGYFDPTIYANRDYDGHNAWDFAYYPYASSSLPYAGYNGKTLIRWFLDYTSSNLVLLPVVLKSFNAALDPNKTVNLQWVTSLESNTSHFEIERSFNGKDFTMIGKVNAKGNSSTDLKYSLTDPQPGDGNTYYRIKMVDKDSRFEYSSVRRVIIQNRGLDFAVNPNPVNTEFTFTATGRALVDLDLTLTDQSGRVVKRFSAQKNRTDLSQKYPVGDLSGGVYFLTVTGEGVRYTQRLVKF